MKRASWDPEEEGTKTVGDIMVPVEAAGGDDATSGEAAGKGKLQ
jgi:hypothetical protein